MKFNSKQVKICVRNNYNREIQLAKTNYDSKLRDYLHQNSNNISNKKWWNISKEFLGQKKKSSYPPLHSNNDIIVNDIKKCETFNNFFLSHSSIDTSNANLPELISNTINSLSDIVLYISGY